MAVNRNADRLDTGRIVAPNRIIATGHQAWLWHPGILAKFLAMKHACTTLNTQPIHIVVDHDCYNPLDIPYPDCDGLRLVERNLAIGNCREDVPTAFQQHINLQTLRNQTDPLFLPIARAAENMPQCRNLAEQFTVLISRLMSKYVGKLPTLFASDLPAMTLYQSFLNDMISDARNCANTCNTAVRQHDRWGLSRLTIRDDIVELPLWAIGWNMPRKRVFINDRNHRNTLVFESGEHIDTETYQLLPRAITLTAVLRMHYCDLFIHGTGGQLYDQVTNTWLKQWRGIELAPVTVVSADLYMNFNVPLADRKQLDHALWYRHHLPHNINRYVNINPTLKPLVQRKMQLIQHMNDDRDRNRRQQAYHDIQETNRMLAAAYDDEIGRADQNLETARIGLANSRIARKRNWCFAFYDAKQLQELSREFEWPDRKQAEI